MRPVTVINTQTGNSRPIVLDYMLDFQVGFVFDADGTNTNDLEVSYDDPFATYATDYNTNAVWFKVTDFTGMGGADVQGNLPPDRPVRAVRLNTTAYTNGSPRLTIVQGGSRV